MKIALSLFAFILTLTITHITLAEEQGHETLSKAEQEKAATVEHMRTLFPPKQPVAGMAVVPAKTELLQPPYFATVTGDKATLKWKAVDGADLYHVQVATDPNFKWLVAEDYAVKNNSFEVGQLVAGNHYYWRVNAVKENNEPTHRKSGFVTSMFEVK